MPLAPHLEKKPLSPAMIDNLRKLLEEGQDKRVVIVPTVAAALVSRGLAKRDDRRCLAITDKGRAAVAESQRALA